MLNSKVVRELFYDWAKDWRRGLEPKKFNEFYDLIIGSHITKSLDYQKLCDLIINDLSSHHYNDIRPMQVGAIIASMLLICPAKDFGSMRCILLDKIAETFQVRDVPQSIYFQHGCILGLLKAVVVLRKLDDRYDDFENKVWTLIMRASRLADRNSKWQQDFNFKGQFSNILADYLLIDQNENLGLMMEALVDSSKLMKKSNNSYHTYAPEGSTRFLINEITHKIFSKLATGDDRVWMIEHYQKHKKQEESLINK